MGDFTVTRAWRSYGSFDPNSITNLANAKAAGIPYNDVYMFPCRGESASSQVDTMIKDLKNGLAGHPINASISLPEHVIEAKGLGAGYGRTRLAQAQLDKKRELKIVDNTPSNIPKWRTAQDGASYGMIWFDIEENPSSGCGWGTSYSSNCAYLQQLI